MVETSSRAKSSKMFFFFEISSSSSLSTYLCSYTFITPAKHRCCASKSEAGEPESSKGARKTRKKAIILIIINHDEICVLSSGGFPTVLQSEAHAHVF